MKQKRFLSMLVLLAAVATGAMAQTETLLTTITPTAKEQASYSTANVATVSFSYTAGGSSAYLANWGWWGYGWIATVTAAEGYTITKCIFYDDANRTATDSKAPFVVETTEEDKTPRINGTPIDGGNMWSKGIKKIEVYGYVTPAPTGYSVTLAEGTEDADKWTVKVGEGQAQALPIGGLKGDGSETVTLQYTGRLKVKGVKAVSDAAPAAKPAATVTTAPTGATGLTTASAVTEKLVTGGVADGGTLKYAITSTTTQPDDAAFTLTISPTVSDLKTALSMSTLAAGTYYVWYKVFADADHADSEAAYVSVAVAQIINWNSSNISDLRVYGTHPYTKEGITLSANGMSEAMWHNHGSESGISFEMMGSGGYTFTAPTGQKFTKIEMTLTGPFGWDDASLGTGWAFDIDYTNMIAKVTWTGNAASTVGLLTGTDHFYGESVKSIAFYLSE